MGAPRHDRHTAIYAWLLGVYPRGYRRDVGDAAVEAFRDLALATRRDEGWWGLARLWCATLPRVVWGGLGEHVAELRDARWGAVAETRDDRPPYGTAFAVGVAVLALYVVTLAPTTAFWDTSEYIATAHILGIPHPPGNPLFVVLARTWELLLAPLGLSVATRINLFSAVMSATAHGFWFLVVHRILGAFDARRVFRLAGASAAVLVSATAFTVWNQSNVNEKVYTVSLLTIALLSWLALRWQARPEGARSGNLLALMALVLGSSVGNHLMALLAAPAIVVLVALVRPRTFLRWRLYPAVLVAGMAGLTIHLFLPIRAELGPIINQGAPQCPSIESALGSVLSYGRAGCETLSASLNREQYQKPPVLERQAPLGAQLINYLQYFDWQWARAVDGTRSLFSAARLPFTLLFAGLGLWGAMEHRLRDRKTFWYMLTLFGTVSVALTFYLNFEYGFAFPGPADTPISREVRERDYFFIASFSLWGLWAGMGIAALWLRLSRHAGRGLLRASPILLVACIPLVLNARWADRSYDYAARDYAYNLLQSIEPYGVLFTAGDNDTFPLWYLQEVEGVRRDVTVVVTSYLRVPWYAKQLRDLTRPCGGENASAQPTRIVCQREYVPGPHVAYAAAGERVAPGVVPLVMPKPAKRPMLPIMQLDDQTIDRIGASYFVVEHPIELRLGSITSVIPPDQVLEPWHQYALAIVDTAFTDARPVYWSNSGPDAASLGLHPYLVRQGVAYKVHDGPLADEPPAGVLRLAADPSLLRGTGAWLDVPRTERLVNEVFVHRSGLPDWDHWPDPSTALIPYYYAWAYYALAVAAENRGEAELADRYFVAGEDWMELVLVRE
jgi:hypothetical protein